MLWVTGGAPQVNPALRAVWFADILIVASQFARQGDSPLCGEMSEGQRGRVQVRCASAIPSSEGTTIIIKEIINMITKTISMCQGKGSLSHNNREFTAKNIDPSRTADNIVFIQQGK